MTRVGPALGEDLVGAVRRLLGEHGLEFAAGQEGFAVFTGSEGDDPQFLGFFFDERSARELVDLKGPDGTELYCDPIVVPALLTAHGVVAANDFELTLHGHVRERLQAALTPPTGGEPLTVLNASTLEGARAEAVLAVWRRIELSREGLSALTEAL